MPTSTPSSAIDRALLIVDEAIRCGVREAVLCPGSRSAPLAFALAEAHRAGRLRLHVRTDERSGAFLALGLAAESRRPVPIVMTSGTAVANCLPAMVEATLSGVPLLVFSANRPWELVGTGANQTIEQQRIFAEHSVLETGLPQDATPADTRARVAEVIAAATDPHRGGGAHLDIPLSEPLVPDSLDELTLAARALADSDAGVAAGDGAGAASSSLTDAGSAPTSDGPHGTVTVDLSLNTLVISGSCPDTAWQRRMLDELSAIPTVAEPTSPTPNTPLHPLGLSTIALSCGNAATAGSDSDATAAVDAAPAGPAADPVLLKAVRPAQIIVIGRPTLHRSVSRLLAEPDIHIIALSPTEAITDVAGTVNATGSSIRVSGEPNGEWLRLCDTLSTVAAGVVRDGLIDALREPEGEGDDAGVGKEENAGVPATPSVPMTGLHAMAIIADQLAVGDALVLGASSAIRDASYVGLPFDGVSVTSNRGAAGIDGTVSTAVGVALARSAAHREELRAPRTIAVMGDLTFAHDLGGLNVGPLEPRPDNLLIVVLNDAGGAIFESLEPGAEGLRTHSDGSEVYERIFATPTALDQRGAIVNTATLFGLDAYEATTPLELVEALAEHQDYGGWGILEVQCDRASRRELMHAMTTAMTLGNLR